MCWALALTFLGCVLASTHSISFLRLHSRHLYPSWSLWGWRWCQTWTGSKKCHGLCTRHCQWHRPMQLLSASIALRRFPLNLCCVSCSSRSLAFEAPFYGEACEKGECPPGHRLERHAEVALAQYAECQLCPIPLPSWEHFTVLRWNNRPRSTHNGKLVYLVRRVASRRSLAIRTLSRARR